MVETEEEVKVEAAKAAVGREEGLVAAKEVVERAVEREAAMEEGGKVEESKVAKRIDGCSPRTVPYSQ